MKEINLTESEFASEMVSGGNPVLTTILIVDIFTSAPDVPAAMATYNQWGHDLGKWMYDSTH